MKLRTLSFLLALAASFGPEAIAQDRTLEMTGARITPRGIEVLLPRSAEFHSRGDFWTACKLTMCDALRRTAISMAAARRAEFKALELEAEATETGRTIDEVRKERSRLYDRWLAEQTRDTEQRAKQVKTAATTTAAGRKGSEGD